MGVMRAEVEKLLKSLTLLLIAQIRCFLRQNYQHYINMAPLHRFQNWRSNMGAKSYVIPINFNVFFTTK